MYAFLSSKIQPPINQPVEVCSEIKPSTSYDWFTYDGPVVTIMYRDKPCEVRKGQRFGVRKSGSGKQIRLVLGDEVNRVFTIDLETAKKLAKHVRKES